MSRNMEVEVTIEGTVPLIQGRTVDHPEPDDLWQERLYISPEGLLYQPSVDLIKCFKKAREIDMSLATGQYILFEDCLFPTLK